MKKIVIFLLLNVLIFNKSFSQQLLNQDIRTVQIDKLSDEEIKSFYDKAKASNLSDNQIAEYLTSKGLPSGELIKLQKRVQALKNNTSSTGNNNNNSPTTGNDNRQTMPEDKQTFEVKLDSFEQKIYGMDIFTNPSLAFEPNLRLATPANYILGPDDELRINVYGYSETEYRVTVSPEGNIMIPNVGPIYVNGLSISAAKTKITQKLGSTIYRAIQTGRTQVQVTLGNLRTIKVVVIGQAKKPGTYTVSSFATLFNVLYLCGGPGKQGSFRNIEILRDGKVLLHADLYDFIHNGIMTSNISLQENDVIRIPYYEKRVELSGEFKRPGYFEAKENENLAKTISYAGGISDSGYRSQLRIMQINGKERRIQVVDEAAFASYIPGSGDVVIAEKVSARYENRVILLGAVVRPGEYDLTTGLTLKQLLRKADGLKEDAFASRITISRLREDVTRELLSYDVKNIMNNSNNDVPLQREDIITVPSLIELRDVLSISIEGEVRKPGSVSYKVGMTIKDAILEAGGFTEAATGKRLEIGRRIVNAEAGKQNTQIAEVINIDTEKDLNITGNSIVLQPNDIIIVRNNPGYFIQKTVTVNGEANYTGKYVIGERNERVSDLITRSGGFTSLADPTASSLERLNRSFEQDTAYKTITLDRFGFDSTKKEEPFKKVEKIGINLNDIMKNPHSSIDIILEDGDILTIPKKDGVVKVKGEVLVPTQLSYIEGQNMQFYIHRAGGFTDKAARKKAFVIAANGNAKRTKSFLFFKSYPSIHAGDEIFIPMEQERKGLSTGEVISIASGLASLAGVIIAILNATK
jgi:protein involved in polysaccharide export with SLBB domain